MNPIEHSFHEAQHVLAQFINDREQFGRVQLFADKLAATFLAGCKAMACGNGGSMSDAMHFAEEWSGRYRRERRPLPAIALSDPGHMSCVANDYGFAEVFSRQVQALGSEGDLLLMLSTSGNSPNLIRAAEEARTRGVTTVGLLGKGGGTLLAHCDIPIVVPGGTSDRIQEIHIKIIHIVIETVERQLFPELY
ncbi:MAG: SIS domain-containing protein [Bacteroidota bacterium]|jgi:D-sedoheptulose 7-phosphate isomerase|nr:SIS domain-containing protein [Bacteroidota bacterium]